MRAARVAWVWVVALGGCGEVVTEPDHADVTISPAAPKTADDLTATTDAAMATLRWTKNGEVRTDITGSRVTASLTTKGETWGVDAVSDAGEVIGHAEVVIGNTEPQPFDVAVELTGVANTEVPCAIVTPSSDDDNDTLTFTATWLRNGVAYPAATQTTFAGDTVPAADHAAGDQFECSVTASDGTAMVTAIAGARVLVPNGVPPMGTLQMFVTPANATTLRIEAAGSDGSNGAATNGAKMIGTFSPSAGTTLSILVGQRPSSSLGGGGGTFVMAPGNMPLVIAGGGGSTTGTITMEESVGRITTSGGTAGATARADNGQGGRIVAGSNSGAGGGLMTNGSGTTAGGKSFVGGAAGGGMVGEAWGGFGGGGGRIGLWGQGGGGGYSGGSCGDTFTPGTPGTGTWAGCGGGGSLNMGLDQDNTAGTNAGPGYVKITW